MMLVWANEAPTDIISSSQLAPPHKHTPTQEMEACIAVLTSEVADVGHARADEHLCKDKRFTVSAEAARANCNQTRALAITILAKHN
jgi:hypothetical protein